MAPMGAIFVPQPTQLQNDFTTTDASCNGLSDGIIETETNGGTPPYSYNGLTGAPPWTAGVGQYIVTIIDFNGCSVIDTASVGEPEVLTITLNQNISFGEFSVSCHGEDDGQIIATVVGGTPEFSYVWSLGTQNPNTPHLTENVSVPNSGLCSVTVTDDNGCTETASIPLSQPAEIEVVDVDLYHVDCYGGTDGEIRLFPDGGILDGTEEYTYTWTPSVSHPIDNDGSIAINLPANVEFTVTIEALYGCSESFVYELDQPEELFVADVKTVNYAGPGKAPYIIDFEDITTNSSGLIPIADLTHTWCWNYDIVWDANMQAYDTICNDATPANQTGRGFQKPDGFTNIGANDIYVTVEYNETGCTHKINFTIEVQGMPEINNVFSPNSDGINDVFSIGEVGMDNISVSILNRWGEQVYSWEGDGGEWDGKGVDGQTLSEGVYFYILKATGMDGYYYEKKGSVTLVR